MKRSEPMNINAVRDKERQLIEAMTPFINAGSQMVAYASEKPPIINMSHYIAVATLYAELEELREEESRRWAEVRQGINIVGN